ncbi:MAG: tetratricopeptide repeat protein [Chloroflexota bacterium]|nr:tetratricopeptide repeat protein [Chloroflexota bacterium]
MAAVSIRGVTIFYCYATEDEKHLHGLEKQLGSLKRLGKVTTWYDRHIAPGMEWEHEINAHLDAADIILLLVSPDFMQSDYCYNVEMKRALERHKGPDKTEVIPIIVRPVNWQDTPMGKLQAWPVRGKPVTLWSNRDEGYQNAARGITKVVSAQLARQWKDEGKSYYMIDQHEDALEAYNEALRLMPKDVDFELQNAELHRDKGHALLRLNRFNEALDAYDEAIQCRPADEHFYIHKGHAFLKLQRFKEALVTYDKAARVNPSNAYARVHKGYVQLDLQRPTDALAAFEQALQLNPNIGMAYIGKGKALDALGQTSEAQQAYGQARSLGQAI